MDGTAIPSLVAEIQAAWNAHDMRRFALCFTEDADFVNVAGVWWRGRMEIEERHAASHAGRFSRSRIELELAEARTITADVAVAHIRWTLRGHEASGPRRTTDIRHGMWTWVVRDGDGGPRIAAAHNTDTLRPETR